MQIRTAVLAIVATSALSTAAFAAVSGRAQDSADAGHPSSREQVSDRCAALESQYSNAIGDRQHAAKLGRAEGLHSVGVAECESNQGETGAVKLEQSLHDLGVKPAA
jgi:hypothetical protein